MSYFIEFSTDAQKDIKKWKKSSPNLHKKFKTIIDELVEHPRTGTGHPEALRGGEGVTWSRRISAHDRIIYNIYEDTVTVLVVEVGGHYNDK